MARQIAQLIPAQALSRADAVAVFDDCNRIGFCMSNMNYYMPRPDLVFIAIEPGKQLRRCGLRCEKQRL
ncbi:MAG TPA: hypothetical protein VF427_08475 [Noviherbaspirillum sp.]